MSRTYWFGPPRDGSQRARCTHNGTRSRRSALGVAHTEDALFEAASLQSGGSTESSASAVADRVAAIP